MKIAVIAPNYPTENSFSYSFVHDRLVKYQSLGHEIKVFIISKNKIIYAYEGVNVLKAPKKILRKSIEEYGAEVLAIHFPKYYIINFINTINKPKIVWLHGGDILWRFTLRKQKNLLKMLLKYLILFPRMGYQIHLLKKYLPKYANCVFVSEGFLKQAQKQTRRKFPNAVVIANPVDMDLFTFQEPKFSPRGLSLRSFSTAIYGFDISIKAFQKTENAHLDIYGKGVLKSKYEQMSKSLGANVSIISKHLKHDDIPELYSQYSYFVTTTRADTQGLAMCEAMACGLPAIATNVGGIPDYVIDGYNGYLVERDNPESARKAVEKLLSDENKYYEMSRNARKLMEEKCSSDVVVAKELDLLKQAIEKWEK